MEKTILRNYFFSNLPIHLSVYFYSLQKYDRKAVHKGKFLVIAPTLISLRPKIAPRTGCAYLAH